MGILFITIEDGEIAVRKVQVEFTGLTEVEFVVIAGTGQVLFVASEGVGDRIGGVTIAEELATIAGRAFILAFFGTDWADWIHGGL